MDETSSERLPATDQSTLIARLRAGFAKFAPGRNAD